PPRWVSFHFSEWITFTFSFTMGARIAALRRNAGLSQAQLAEALDIPQRTLSFYEREAGDIPAGLVSQLARALDVSVEEVLGVPQAAAKKRGPKSQLEKQLEAVAELPRSQQQRILDVVQALIARAQASG
ncbi:MAG: helix-turn-helix transcriptional regulator, partial [Blastocatellales bacterium]|nr:helix-turn-helix transcriptional regulator [Blastocatellales bacterium]